MSATSTIDVPPPPPPLPDEPPPDSLTDRPGRVLVLLVGGLLTLALLAFGTFNVVTVIAHDESTSTVSFPASVRHVSVAVGRGDVTILGQAGSAREGITGTRTVNRGLTSPTYREQVDGDTLRIESSCTAIMNWCSVSYSLEVPADVTVEVESSSGDVYVRNLDGLVTLTASSGDLRAESIGALTATSTSGDITVVGADGRVALSAHSGDVTASGLAGATAMAEATSGDVALAFSTAPMEAQAQTSSGAITMTVPDDEARYQVDASSSSGSVHEDVKREPNGERRLVASSSSGDIVISQAVR